jgi:TrmH family RNA methyltransferase
MKNMKLLERKLNLRSRFTVILAKPENPENIGMVARHMKNTGFRQLRIVGVSRLGQKAFKTAVHAQEILNSVKTFGNLEEATADLGLVFAATAKRRKNFSLMSLDEAVERMLRFAGSTKIGLLFGNERTGLLSEELKSSNFRFIIPQAIRQPSYNLASAVLLTLFHIFVGASHFLPKREGERPLSLAEQKECIEMILLKLKKTRFVHETNEEHIGEMVYDIFGRLGMTDKDRRFLLALFSKGTKRNEEMKGDGK